MQTVVNRWTDRRQVIEADIMAKIAPTRLSGINLRGVFRFPVEICGRFDAVAGSADKCDRWLKPITV